MRIRVWSSGVWSSDLANCCVLRSYIDGLYTANPHKYPDARLIEHVEAITDEIVAMADGGSSSGMGSGGMLSKLEAAKIANSAGVHLAIIRGHKDHPLSAFRSEARRVGKECVTYV